MEQGCGGEFQDGMEWYGQGDRAAMQTRREIEIMSDFDLNIMLGRFFDNRTFRTSPMMFCEDLGECQKAEAALSPAQWMGYLTYIKSCASFNLSRELETKIGVFLKKKVPDSQLFLHEMLYTATYLALNVSARHRAEALLFALITEEIEEEEGQVHEN